MFNIRTVWINKAIAQLPQIINFAKSKCWILTLTHAHTHTHTRRQDIYSIKWPNVQREKTLQTKCAIKLIHVSKWQKTRGPVPQPKSVWARTTSTPFLPLPWECLHSLNQKSNSKTKGKKDHQVLVQNSREKKQNWTICLTVTVSVVPNPLQMRNTLVSNQRSVRIQEWAEPVRSVPHSLVLHPHSLVSAVVYVFSAQSASHSHGRGKSVKVKANVHVSNFGKYWRPPVPQLRFRHFPSCIHTLLKRGKKAQSLTSSWWLWLIIQCQAKKQYRGAA